MTDYWKAQMGITEIDRDICDILMNHGPDGHIDGYERLTEYVVAISARVRRETLEEAAKVCDRGAMLPEYDRRSLEHAAAAIRALIPSAPRG